MTPAMREALHATDVLQAVERRLLDAGAWAELDIFRGLSSQELDVLVMRETGAGRSVGEASAVDAPRVEVAA